MTDKSGDQQGLDDLARQAFGNKKPVSRKGNAAQKPVAGESMSMQELITGASDNIRLKQAARKTTLGTGPDADLQSAIAWDNQINRSSAGNKKPVRNQESFEDILKSTKGAGADKKVMPGPTSRPAAEKPVEDLGELAHAARKADREVFVKSPQAHKVTAKSAAEPLSNSAHALSASGEMADSGGVLPASTGKARASASASRTAAMSADVQMASVSSSSSASRHVASGRGYADGADYQPETVKRVRLGSGLLVRGLGVLALIVVLAGLLYKGTLQVIDSEVVAALSPQEVLVEMDEEISDVLESGASMPSLISLTSFPQDAVEWPINYWGLRDANGRDEIMFSEMGEGRYVLIYRSGNTAWLKKNGEPVETTSAQ